MKVRELIEALQALDPEKEIVIGMRGYAYEISSAPCEVNLSTFWGDDPEETYYCLRTREQIGGIQ